jgi:FAD/FMN-containing dehydrogenase
MSALPTTAISALQELFQDRFLTDSVTRILYATDASAYREMPVGVVFPKDKTEIQKLVQLTDLFDFSLITRAACTSLTGHLVGNWADFFSLG